MIKQNSELTQRERHVLCEALKGKTIEGIANTLFITNHTVKAHLKNIFAKTGTKSRLELFSKLFTIILETNISNEQLLNAINMLTQYKK